MSETKFVDGLIAKKPSPKAPDYIICNLSLNKEKLLNFLHNQEGEFINVDVLETKDKSKFYAKINDWKPEKNYVKKEEAEEEIKIEDIPF